jgi:predicted transcriptional regulator of viral defense system
MVSKLPKLRTPIFFGSPSGGTGEIEGTRQQLAEVAGKNPVEVTRALSRLVEIGALVRTERGRYIVHPSAAWNGSLTTREAAERKLTVVEPTE